MDSKEGHITTFVSMAPWREPALQVLLVMNPRADKSRGETREGGHKRHAWKPIMKGSKGPCNGVIRPAFPPGPIGDLFGSAWGVRCRQLLKHPFIGGVSLGRARLEKF